MVVLLILGTAPLVNPVLESCDGRAMHDFTAAGPYGKGSGKMEP